MVACNGNSKSGAASFAFSPASAAICSYLWWASGPRDTTHAAIWSPQRRSFASTRSASATRH